MNLKNTNKKHLCKQSERYHMGAPRVRLPRKLPLPLGLPPPLLVLGGLFGLRASIRSVHPVVSRPSVK